MGVNFIKKQLKNPPTLSEWSNWNNISLWPKIAKKWFTLLEWFTLLSILEFVRTKTESWQFNLFLTVSWFIVYAYLNSIVITILGKAVKIHKTLIFISILLSGIFSYSLYSLSQVIVLNLIKQFE